MTKYILLSSTSPAPPDSKYLDPCSSMCSFDSQGSDCSLRAMRGPSSLGFVELDVKPDSVVNRRVSLQIRKQLNLTMVLIAMCEQQVKLFEQGTTAELMV